MKNREDLRKLLLSIDHKGYPAYKETRGAWDFGSFELHIDHVQGDPFASPSSLHLFIPGKTLRYPAEYYTPAHRRIAFQDCLLRCFCGCLEGREQGHAGSGKSGLVITSRPGQEILERTACRIDPASGSLTLRFQAGFPAAGRTIQVRELVRIFFTFLPETVDSLCARRLNAARIRDVLFLADDQKYIRDWLRENGCCAFVADGSVLPRASGVSSYPMENAVPFVSPEETAVTLTLPHKGAVRGMGIHAGVTLIVGGGYHGKSTLLQALERGVYDHIRGDGREYVITDASAMKIRAEDGRCIHATDISLFIHDLPNGKDTVSFDSEDASGSTSQAANVIEAIEAGTSVLLIDEDTSATNFMVRDELMASVVSRDKEPITPFLSRIRLLYEQAGISTILVAGSSGAFFRPADCILQMNRYVPEDITALAKAAADRFKRSSVSAAADSALPAGSADPAASPDTACAPEDGSPSLPQFTRRPEADRRLRSDDRIKLKVLSEDAFLVGRTEVDVRGLEQLTDREQTAALAYALKYLELHIFDGKKTFRACMRELRSLLERDGLEVLFDGATVGNGLAMPRDAELFAMANRYRPLLIHR